tara:strand:- start:638 stop:1108 length:471 start_codon:yes stop_codon:yes gene_type:complete
LKNSIFATVVLTTTGYLLWPRLMVATDTPKIGHATEKQIDLEKLLRAIRIVESNDNPDAVGDNGDAIGCYQIHYSYWLDAKNHCQLDGDYSSCYDREYATEVVLCYADLYTTEERLGREPTEEDFSRNHNGGPNGYKKESTKKFWNKVKKVKDELK